MSEAKLSSAAGAEITKPSKKALALFRRKREADDALGQVSDHEGDEGGPTHYLYRSCTLEKYKEHIAIQIDWHQEDIRILRALLREKRKQSNTERSTQND